MSVIMVIIMVRKEKNRKKKTQLAHYIKRGMTFPKQKKYNKLQQKIGILERKTSKIKGEMED